MNTRKQLTLFLNEEESKMIEEVRKNYNFEQYTLIKSHITLCREDELENLDTILKNLEKIKNLYLSLNFQKPVRFGDDEKGVFLPAEHPNEGFIDLRKKILKNVIENPRLSEPHITLIHPRNGICTDEIFAEITKIAFPTKFSFQKIHLIEQKNGEKWEVLAVFWKNI